MKKLLFTILTALIVVACGKTATEQNKDAVVKTIYSGTLGQGRYVIFWDGTNESGQFVAAGTYYARLWARDFTFQITLTAEAGGTGVSNDSSLADPGPYALPQLDQNTPNPFKVQDGTNLPFNLDGTYAIELTIRDQE